jgi:hypothetical protein
MAHKWTKAQRKRLSETMKAQLRKRGKPRPVSQVFRDPPHDKRFSRQWRDADMRVNGRERMEQLANDYLLALPLDVKLVSISVIMRERGDKLETG